MTVPQAPLRTVVVLGVAYGGANAVSTLARRLPVGWRVIAIDRTSHGNRASLRCASSR